MYSEEKLVLKTLLFLQDFWNQKYHLFFSWYSLLEHAKQNVITTTLPNFEYIKTSIKIISIDINRVEQIRLWHLIQRIVPTNIYLFKVNNRNTIRRCEIFSKFIIKTREHIVNFEHILHHFLVFLLLTQNK